MAKERSHDETGAGRSQRRTVSEISFHSLCHTATSLLKNAGVSSAVAMDIIRHDTEAINRHYTYIESETKRSALNKLPSVIAFYLCRTSEVNHYLSARDADAGALRGELEVRFDPSEMRARLLARGPARR